MAIDENRPSPQEEDKAKMLFGNRHAVNSFNLIAMRFSCNNYNLSNFFFPARKQKHQKRCVQVSDEAVNQS